MTIKRNDGKEFTLDLSKLSTPDQEFIEKWRKENPQEAAPAAPVVGKLELNYRVTKKKVGSRKLGKKRSEETWRYEVALTNRSRKPLPKLTVKYEMFIRYYNKYAKIKRAVARTEQGEYVIEGIAANGSVEFKTKGAKLLTDKSRELNGDIVYVTQYEEDLVGLIIQFYQGEKKVGEHTYGRTKRN